MATAPSLSVSVECVNACNLSRVEGVTGWYDCSVLSCAWKVPRALTGSLASTPNPSCSSSLHSRRNRSSRCNYLRKVSDVVSSYSFTDSLRSSHSSINSVPSKEWRTGCSKEWSMGCSSSITAKTSNEVSPESLWEDLKPAILYLPQNELDLVHKALKLAFEAHDGQKRRSGEPFIIHPVEVARILGEHELDWESIAAGLLHDTVEDTNLVTFERIEIDFGSTVRYIVEGETKVSKLGKLKYKNETDAIQDVKAEDLRQMFLAMTEEVRVIIVKLADRLHNMRTLSHMPPHKQASIAVETLQVFAPLAKLLGMYKIKSELENLSFMYTDAQEYIKVTKKISELYKEHEREIFEANKIIMNKIEDDQFLSLVTLKTDVHAICREPYSIYKAVVKSNCTIDEFNQIAQLRIVVKPKPCNGIGPLCSEEQICYHVLGIVHGIWTPVPRSMKDYIATSKPNGYKSLHTTVIPFLYESMFRLEVQIRTEEMDLIAQRGIATHYNGRQPFNGFVGYTKHNSRSSGGKSVCVKGNIGLRIGWLNAIREWQEEFVGNMTSREFVETITRDLLGSRVFVFTPRGEIKNLPKGATVVDYAYMIHTEIGNKMVAAKVNGIPVSPTHVLANAEVVEILTYDALSSKSAFEKHKQWLHHAKTRSARHKIMRFLREQAELSAAEITTDSILAFTADSNKDDLMGNSSRGSKPHSDTKNGALPSLPKTSNGLCNGSIVTSNGLSNNGTVTPTSYGLCNGSILTPKVNGKNNKHVKSIKLSDKAEEDNEIAEVLRHNIPMFKEVIPALESWQASKIDAWHSMEGHSIQWLCIISMDRRGVMAEVTKVLASLEFSVCSCAAEMDRSWGMAVMLFQIEGNPDNLVDTCSRIDAIHGVLGWSTGCSWQPSIEHPKHLSC